MVHTERPYSYLLHYIRHRTSDGQQEKKKPSADFALLFIYYKKRRTAVDVGLSLILVPSTVLLAATSTI